MNLFEKTAHELSALLTAKEISAVEVLDSVYARVDAVEGEVGAYITQTRERAKEQAQAVDAKIAAGEKLSPVAGIPLAVKDNIGVKGVPLTCASRMLESYVPPFSATVIDRLAENGAVFTGKVNLDEFAMGSSGETSYFKKTRNPQDLSRVPGGSSGGSAAALAAGEAVLALGSDTGGSVRLPAAYCGVVGLKPTYGAVSRYGAVAFGSSLDQISPMGRCVKDVATLFSAICGYDKMDATSANREYPDFAATLESDVKGKVIGIPKEYFGHGVEKEIADTVMAAVKKFEDAGAHIKEISLPSTDYALSAYYIISSAEASSNLARFDGIRFGYRAATYSDVNELIEKSRSEGFGAEVKRRILLGTNILSSGYYDAYYKRAALVRERIKAEFDAAFASCDCMIAPTSPTTAIKLGENIGDPVKMYAMDVCTVGISIAGIPAISVPCGRAADGLPVGMQIIGKKFDEQTVLQMAYRHEQAYGIEQLPDIKAAAERSPK